jgi:hypothetical protein
LRHATRRGPGSDEFPRDRRRGTSQELGHAQLAGRHFLPMPRAAGQMGHGPPCI